MSGRNVASGIKSPEQHSATISPHELASLVLGLAPLQTADELAELTRAMKVYPTGTPGRALRVHSFVSFALRCDADRVSALIGILETRAAALLAPAVDDADGDTIVLIPPVVRCVACGHTGLSDIRRGERMRTYGKAIYPTCACDLAVTGAIWI